MFLPGGLENLPPPHSSNLSVVARFRQNRGMEKLFTEDDIKNAFECGVHYAKPAKTLSKTFNWRDALFGEGFRNEALFNCPGYSPTADSRVGGGTAWTWWPRPSRPRKLASDAHGEKETSSNQGTTKRPTGVRSAWTPRLNVS